MKKSFLLPVAMTLALTLSACGSNTSRTIPTVVPQTDASGMTTKYQNAIPIESQLVVGTFKLEQTDKAVSAKQAADLVPYWQLIKELTTGGTAAQEEIDATVEAIESAMTPDQIKTIASMQLTRQDLFTILREQGGGFGAGTQRTQNTQGQGTNNRRNFNFGPGGVEGGPPPGAGFGPGGGSGSQQTNSNRSSNSQSSNSNGNGTNFSSNRVPSVLLDAVIKLLQEKAKT